MLENTTSYQTLLNNQDKWRSINISPTFEYTVNSKLDLLSDIPIGYTIQKEGTTSFEISPIVGGKFYISQGKRFDVRFLLRFQQRYFHQIEQNDWDISHRTRLKGEIFFSINGPSLFNDNLWYAFTDYEEFLVLDQQLEERFAFRRRARLGLGYRLNYKNRFEMSYTRQSSRNEIDGNFISDDNVIQIKYKMYLNPARPANAPSE